MASRRKEIIPEINKIHTKNTLEKISETKSLFFEEMNKIHNSLPILIKEKKKIQITNTNEREYHYRSHRHQKNNKTVL